MRYGKKEGLTSVQGTGVAVTIEKVLMNSIATARKLDVGRILIQPTFLPNCKNWTNSTEQNQTLKSRERKAPAGT